MTPGSSGLPNGAPSGSCAELPQALAPRALGTLIALQACGALLAPVGTLMLRRIAISGTLLVAACSSTYVGKGDGDGPGGGGTGGPNRPSTPRAGRDTPIMMPPVGSAGREQPTAGSGPVVVPPGMPRAAFSAIVKEGGTVALNIMSSQPLFAWSCSYRPVLEKADSGVWVPLQDDAPPHSDNPGHYLDGRFVPPSRISAATRSTAGNSQPRRASGEPSSTCRPALPCLRRRRTRGAMLAFQFPKMFPSRRSKAGVCAARCASASRISKTASARRCKPSTYLSKYPRASAAHTATRTTAAALATPAVGPRPKPCAAESPSTQMRSTCGASMPGAARSWSTTKRGAATAGTMQASSNAYQVPSALDSIASLPPRRQERP